MAVSLPEWLFADNTDADRVFVLHTHWPRFLMEVDEASGEGQVVMEIDPPSEVIDAELKAGREPARLMARLMREAGEFYCGRWTQAKSRPSRFGGDRAGAMPAGCELVTHACHSSGRSPSTLTQHTAWRTDGQGLPGRQKFAVWRHDPSQIFRAHTSGGGGQPTNDFRTGKALTREYTRRIHKSHNVSLSELRNSWNC